MSVCVCALTFPAMWAHRGVVVFTKVNVVSMGFYILPTNIAIYKYVCINIEGQITKFIFFNRKKKLSSKNGTKDCVRFKLYLYIKRGFWVGLAQLWFSSLYRIGKLWGVCAFVWKSVCVCVLENQLFVIYPKCVVQNTGLSLSLLFSSGIGWGCALTWRDWFGGAVEYSQSS